MAYSSFYGLQIAKTGLFVSQKGLNLTGHNITNANTVGYTRQRMILQSIDPASMMTRFAPVGRGLVGGGVEVQTIERIRNAFIDKELRREYATQGNLGKRLDGIDYIDSLFNEVGNNSISVTLAAFFNAISALQEDGASLELRANMQAAGQSLTESMNYYYQKLVELQKAQNDSMKSAVDEVNDLLESIAAYNKDIYVYELCGENANDLRDKRDLCLDRLSQIIDIEYNTDPDGKLHVTCGTQELVNHIEYNRLVATPNYTCPITGESGYYTIYFDDGVNPPAPLQYTTGEMQGYKHMRDGNSTTQYGIPYIINQLNELCRSLVREFNAVHNGGWTLPDSSGTSYTGIDLFWDDNNTIGNINAGNFRLSDEVIADYKNIAASDTELDAASATNGQWGNNKNVLAMIDLFTSTSVPVVGNFEAYLRGMLVEIGTQGGHLIRLTGSQNSVVNNLESRREGISGVSIDEELTMLIQYQHAYAASSRLITTIDEALDKLINHTGLVGLA